MNKKRKMQPRTELGGSGGHITTAEHERGQGKRFRFSAEAVVLLMDINSVSDF